MDYEVYRLGKREWLLYGSQGVGYLALLDFVFYRSAALFAVLAPMGICYPLILRKDLKRRRKEALKLQFKDATFRLPPGSMQGIRWKMPLPLHWRKWTGFTGRIL